MATGINFVKNEGYYIYVVLFYILCIEDFFNFWSNNIKGKSSRVNDYKVLDIFLDILLEFNK